MKCLRINPYLSASTWDEQTEEKQKKKLTVSGVGCYTYILLHLCVWLYRHFYDHDHFECIFWFTPPPPHSVEQRPFDRFFIDKFILSTLDTFWHLHRTQSERHTTKQTPHFMGLTKKKWSFLVHLFVVFCPYYLMHIIHTRFRCLLILIYLYLLIDRFGIRLILCFFFIPSRCVCGAHIHKT